MIRKSAFANGASNLPEIDGRRYFVWGVALFALKFLIDHTWARFIFQRKWTPLDYVAPGLNIGQVIDNHPDQVFYATMIVLAIPFTAIGLVLTLRRLRSADLPRWLVLLFFVPVVNLLYFAVLAVLPKRERAAPAPLPVLPISEHERLALDYGVDESSPPPRLFVSLVPQNRAGAAFVATFLPVPIVLLLTWLGVSVLRNYGWGVFLGLPFVVGLMSAYTYGVRESCAFGECLGIATLSAIVCVGSLIAFALEGLGCLIMLIPLAYPIVILGCVFGWIMQRRPTCANDWNRVMIALLATLPALLGAETIDRAPPPMYEIISSIEIDAPPGEVWKHVVRFPPLNEKPEWIFRVGGLAYPMSATISGDGVGAIRRCEFSTGTFVEPIEIWDEPRRLTFGVSESPPPLREWSPYSKVHPPHLENFLVSMRGEFRLVDLGNGRTRLEGSTWYRHGLFPAEYWRWWSDYVIHKIHLRVLRHVKTLSERDGAG